MMMLRGEYEGSGPLMFESPLKRYIVGACGRGLFERDSKS